MFTSSSSVPFKAEMVGYKYWINTTLRCLLGCQIKYSSQILYCCTKLYIVLYFTQDFVLALFIYCNPQVRLLNGLWASDKLLHLRPSWDLIADCDSDVPLHKSSAVLRLSPLSGWG